MTMPITSKSGTFHYTLGNEFKDAHVAPNLVEAERKARKLYDPFHADPHRAAVTVIVAGSLNGVTHAEELDPKKPYNWSLLVENVTAVMMGPSDRVGSRGDLGQLEQIHSVIVSGYNTGATTGLITHVAASQ